MTAIDLLARFFAAVNKSPLNYPQAGTLIAIAAGLDNAEDICRFLGQSSPSGATRQLKDLAKRGYVTEVADPLSGVPLYALSANGCNAVREMLHFIPKK